MGGRITDGSSSLSSVISSLEGKESSLVSRSRLFLSGFTLVMAILLPLFPPEPELPEFEWAGEPPEPEALTYADLPG